MRRYMLFFVRRRAVYTMGGVQGNFAFRRSGRLSRLPLTDGFCYTIRTSLKGGKKHYALLVQAHCHESVCLVSDCRFAFLI